MTGHVKRSLTAEERARERAFAFTVAADTAIVLTFVIVAVVGGSLTMLSEAVRGVVLLSIGYYTLWLLGAVHREKLTAFQFGTGKVEQFAWVIVGVSLVLGGLWIAQTVFDTIADADAPAGPMGLALAAIVNAVNLTINAVGYWSMRNAAGGDLSGVLGAELSSRLGSFRGSAILQVTLTLAALAKDPNLVLLFDASGAGLVSLLVIRRGIRMVFSGLGSLFDRPISADMLSRIKAEIDRHVPPESIVDLRTRMGGDRLFVELGVDALSFSTIAGLNLRTREIREAVSDLGTPVDIILVPR